MSTDEQVVEDAVEDQAPIPEEHLVYGIKTCVQQLNAWITSAATRGIEVELVMHDTTTVAAVRVHTYHYEVRIKKVL